MNIYNPEQDRLEQQLFKQLNDIRNKQTPIDVKLKVVDQLITLFSQNNNKNNISIMLKQDIINSTILTIQFLQMVNNIILDAQKIKLCQQIGKLYSIMLNDIIINSYQYQLITTNIKNLLRKCQDKYFYLVNSIINYQSFHQQKFIKDLDIYITIEQNIQMKTMSLPFIKLFSNILQISSQNFTLSNNQVRKFLLNTIGEDYTRKDLIQCLLNHFKFINYKINFNTQIYIAISSQYISIVCFNILYNYIKFIIQGKKYDSNTHKLLQAIKNFVQVNSIPKKYHLFLAKDIVSNLQLIELGEVKRKLKFQQFEKCYRQSAFCIKGNGIVELEVINKNSTNEVQNNQIIKPQILKDIIKQQNEQIQIDANQNLPTYLIIHPKFLSPLKDNHYSILLYLATNQIYLNVIAKYGQKLLQIIFNNLQLPVKTRMAVQFIEKTYDLIVRKITSSPFSPLKYLFIINKNNQQNTRILLNMICSFYSNNLQIPKLILQAQKFFSQISFKNIQNLINQIKNQNIKSKIFIPLPFVKYSGSCQSCSKDVSQMDQKFILNCCCIMCNICYQQSLKRCLELECTKCEGYKSDFVRPKPPKNQYLFIKMDPRSIQQRNRIKNNYRL